MGESYGGHYVPNTVAAIEAGNAALPAGDPALINLKGFAVGNGYTDWFLGMSQRAREHTRRGGREQLALSHASTASS
jgi:carboxypeptidase C (cathepsin A)